MRVTRVRAHHLRAEIAQPFGWSLYTTPIRQALLVEVRTDDGLVGWGESGSGTLPSSAAAFVDEVLRPLVVGADPFDLAGIRQRVHAAYDRAGWTAGGFGSQAFSGLEVALWDLMGQAVGRPVCDLLGGRARDRVAAYATGLYYRPRDSGDQGARLEEAVGYVEAGFRAMKMKIGGLPPGEDVAEVGRLREVVGGDVSLMVDANGAYDAATAIAVGRQLEGLGVAWLEEPVARHDLDGYRMVRQALGIPVTGGEHLGSIEAFRDAFLREALDVAQPDVANCGGLTAAREVAALARAFHVRVFPHVWGTPVAVAAGLHFVATLPSTPATEYPTPLVQDPVFEFDSTPHPIREAMMSPALQPQRGWLSVPTAPGLGVTVDPEVVARFAVVSTG